MRDPEVSDFYGATVGGPEEVGGFDVSMDDTLVMEVLEAEDDISADSPCLVDAKDRITGWSSPFYLTAFEILHDHVYFVGQPVVYDFEKAYDMGVSTLFHNGNLLANFVLCAAQDICEVSMGGLGQGSPPQLAHPV